MARSHSKISTTSSSQKKFKHKLLSASALTLPVLTLAASMLMPLTAMAGDVAPNETPTGWDVKSGGASFDKPADNVLNVTQHTQNVLIDYQSMNVGTNATWEFFQPNSNALAVNRAVGASDDPTQILGTLRANGNVMVLDRNGVIFGKDARIDVGGIVASTGNINEAAFAADGTIELSDFGDGKVENNGMITVAEGGLAALVAPTVVNNGIITAKMGKVELAGGNTKATVDFYGDGLVEFEVTDAAQKAVVDNSGVIDAEGGVIAMTTGGAKAVVDSVINMSGVATAKSVSIEGGQIVLGGTIDASAKNGGGEITVKGADVKVAKGAVLDASATENGDGGTIYVYGDENVFSGAAYAMGGAVAGDGGFVEVSGKDVGYDGSVSTYAANGTSGEFLIDPVHATIHSGTLNSDDGTDKFISADSLSSDLGNNASVTVQADQDINVGTDAVATDVGTGDIDVSSYNTGGGGSAYVYTVPEPQPGDYANNGLYTSAHVHWVQDKNACEASGAGAGCAAAPTAAITGGNLTLQSMIVNLNKNLIVGTGSVTVDADTLNLNGTISGRSTLGGSTTLLSDSRLIGVATLDTINVLSNAANIQQAVDFADGTNSPTDVNVAAGTYTLTNSLNLYKAHVNLKGAQAGVDARLGSGLRTYDGAGETILDLNGNRQVLVQADDITIDGFQLQNSSTDIVYANTASGIGDSNNNGSWDNITVKNNLIRNGGDEGVQLRDTTNANLQYNNITGTSGDALNLASGSTAGFIQDNEIYGTSSDNAQIYVYDSTDITVQRNYIHDITAPSNDAIKMGNKSGSNAGTHVGDVIDNVIENVTQDGIALYGSNAIVSGNVITNSQSVNGAINVAWNNTGNIIENNTITDSSRGIRVSGGTNLIIRNNVFDNNTNGHILFNNGVDVSTDTVFGNSFGTSGGFAVNNSGSGTLDAEGNWWGTTSENTIFANRVIGSVDYSVYLGTGTDTDVGTDGFQGDFSDLFVTTQGAQLGAGGRIADGLAMLADGSLTGGDRVIHVMSGAYNENVTIDRNVNLRGWQADIDARTRGGAEATVNGYFMVNPNLDDVTINGFTISNQGTNVLGEVVSVYLNNNVSNIDILNNKFIGNGHANARGVVSSIAGVDNIDIAQNTFTGYATGAYINPNATNVDIDNNTFDGNNVGVSVDGTANITNNLFANSTFEGLGIGGTLGTFTNNQFDNNVQHIGYYNGAGPDIYLEGSGNTFFTNGSYKLVSDMTLDELFALENLITHKMDNAAYGRVHFKDGELFVVNGYTIQGAIDIADAGDTIWIGDGTFNENLNVWKSLTLNGDGTVASTHIDGTGLNGSGITVAANDVTLSGLVIENFVLDYFSSGILVDSVISNLVMDDILARNNGFAGLYVSNNGSIDGLTVTNSRFNNNVFGWYLQKDDNNLANVTTVTDVDVSDTDFDGNSRKGLYVEKLDNATFTDVQVMNSGVDSGNPFGNTGVDINLKNGLYENLTFDNLTVSGSGLNTPSKTGNAFTVKARNDGGYAATPASLNNLVLKNSDITAGGDVAVAIGNNVDGAHIIDNTNITGPEAVLFYGGVQNAEVSGNTIHSTGLSARSAAYGIAFDQTATAEALNNIVTGAGAGAGIVALNASDVTIGGAAPADGNNVSGFKNGIQLDGVSGTTLVQNNTANGNTDSNANRAANGYTTGMGIFVRNVTGGNTVEISDNTTNGNNDGIRILDSDAAVPGDITVSGNTANGNINRGILINRSDNVQVEENTTSGNDVGIWFEASNGGTAQANTVTGNTTTGIQLRNGSNNTQIENNIISGGVNGVFVDGSLGANTGTEIHDNSITGSTKLVRNTSAGTVDASGNWWGTTDEAAVNAAMQGSVDFTPYLALGTDTDGGTNGFQGDFSNLVVTTFGAQTGAGGRIQEAVDHIADGSLTGGDRTVQVNAGLYNESVHVNKALKLLGANTGISGTGVRGAESTIQANGGFDAGWGGTYAVLVDADDVTVDGFDIRGDATDLGTGITLNSADDVMIANNIISSAGFGIAAYGNTATDGTIQNNLIQNSVGAYNYGAYISQNQYLDFLNNTVNGVAVGVAQEWFYDASPTGNTGRIDGNTISASKIGIRNNLAYGTQSGYVISNNTITAENPGESRRWTGIDVISQQNGVATLFQNNTIDGSAVNATRQANGFELTNMTNASRAVIDGGSISNVDVGVWATDGSFYTGAVNDLLVKNVAFSDIDETGILVEDTEDALAQTGVNATGTTITIGAGNTFANTPYDLTVAGDGAQVNLDAGFDGVAKTRVKAAGPAHYVGNPYGTTTNLTTNNGSINVGLGATGTGGEVNVDAGTFREQVEITKSLDLIGAGVGATILESPETLAQSGTNPSGNKNYAIMYIHDATDVNVSGLTIDGTPNTQDAFFNDSNRFVGVLYSNAGGTFENNRITGVASANNKRTGFALLASDNTGAQSDLYITNNTIDGFQKYGIALADGQLNAWLDGNIITGNKAAVTTPGQTGIFVISGADVVADNTNVSDTDIGIENTSSSGNSFDHTTMTGVDIGFRISNSANTSISNVDLNGNSVTGVEVTNSNGFSLNGGTIDHFATGVKVTNSNNVIIDGVTVTDTTTGIRLVSGTGQTITNNTIEDAAGTGLSIEGTSTLATFTDNNFGNNAQHIAYLNGAGADIYADAASGNKFYYDGSFKTTDELTLAQLFDLEDHVTHDMDNASYGHVVLKDGELYVTSNTLGIQNAIDAADAGDTVHVDDSTYTEDLTINKALKLTGHGTTLQSAGGPNLITVTAADVNIDPFVFDGGNVANYGVNVSGADNFVSDGNTYLNFLLDAIHIENSNDIALTGNIIHDVGGNGIEVIGGTGAQIGGSALEANTIYNTGAASITVDGVDGANVSYNDISASSGAGIFAKNALNTTIDNNTIDDVTNRGIGVSGGSNVTVSNNTVDNTGKDGIGGYNNTANLIVTGNFVGTNGAAGNIADNGIWIGNSDGVNINTNTVQNTADHGILLVNSDNSTVGGVGTANIISDTAKAGVRLEGGNDTTVSYNTITNVGGAGINTLNSVGSMIVSNMIDGTVFRGVAINGGNGVQVTANTIDNTGTDGISSSGVTSGLVIADNKVGKNGGANNIGVDGIYVENSVGALVQNNKVQYATDDAVQIAGGSTGAQVLNNTLKDSGGDGVYITDSEGVVVDGNTIKRSNYDGVHAAGSAGAQITNNTINTTNVGDGVLVDASDGSVIDNNTVRYAADNGIHSVDSDNVQVTNNTVNHAGDDGVDFDNSDFALIDNNTVKNSGDDGIDIDGGKKADVTNNTVTNSAENGIDVYDHNKVLIKGNTITNSGGAGIVLTDSNNGKVKNNDVLGATLYGGIGVFDSDDVLVSKNTVKDTNLEGIYVAGSDRAVIENNKVTDIGADGILLEDSLDALIDGNTVKRAENGIHLSDGSTGGTITGNTVRNVDFGGILMDDGALDVSDNDVSKFGFIGIGLANGNGTTIQRNIVDNTDYAGTGIGIASLFGTDVLIGGPGADGNTVNNTFIGIGSAFSSGDVIRRNTVTNTSGYGIGGYQANGLDIRGNKVEDTGIDGIYLIDSADAQIRNNGVRRSGENAIHAEGSDNLLVDNNTVRKTTAGAGVLVEDSDDITISNNDIQKTNGNGIEVIGGVSADIVLNYLNNIMAAVGISVDGNDGVNIADNTVEDTTGVAGTTVGIDVNDSDGAIIGTNLGLGYGLNTVSTGTEAGIRVSNSDSVIITDNDVTDATDADDGTDYGIAMIDSTNSFIVGNTASNRNVGIFVDPSDNIEVSFNNVDGNGVGIMFEDVTNSRILNNTVTNNTDVGIEIGGASNNITVDNNTVEGNPIGILTSGSDVGSVTLTDNFLSGNTTGIRLESGLIDLSSLTNENTILGGDVGLQMAPSVPANLILVGDTLGATKFFSQNNFYIRLEDGAYFIGGTPFQIDALNVSFDGFIPANSPFGPGILTLQQLTDLEAKIFDLDDQTGRGQIFVGFVPGIAEEDLFPNGLGAFGTGGGGFSLTILGLPTVPGGTTGLGAFLNNITPFAGGGSPEDLANITPAAGGNGGDLNDIEPASGNNVSCWGDLGNAVNAGTVSYNFSNSMDDAMDASAACGS